ncbi:MAG: hypothetical protein IJQ82_14380, partial [Selenomonadaceae bacterium]|nr:hypothetical protein [Selenomonadaceae bacterium]
YRDLNDKPILVKPENVFTESELDTEYPEEDYVQIKSEDGNTIKVYELKKAPKHLIIDPRYVKGVEGATETAYVNALKKYRELTDADIVQITFPETDPLGSLNNTQSYSVAFKDLLDKNELPTNEPDPDDSASVNNKNSKYVPVMHNGVKKYIAKANLPYVRVYRNQSANERYPYVPVCDLKIKTTASTVYENDYAGVTLADDEHNAYTKGKLTDAQYKIDDDMNKWKVPKKVMEDYYQKYYDSNAATAQITKTDDDNGMKYFIAKTEEDSATTANDSPETKLNVIAEYKRIANDKFVNVAEGYYTYYNYQTNQDHIDGNDQNVIHLVMDNKGNVQTKALDAGSTEQITNDYKFQPDDPGWNKKTLNLETWEKNKDYRIPEYEVLYKKSAFNLSEDSCYSYFQIPELHRKNYEYLNVDELNQTSERPVAIGTWRICSSRRAAQIGLIDFFLEKNFSLSYDTGAIFFFASRCG